MGAKGGGVRMTHAMPRQSGAPGHTLEWRPRCRIRRISRSACFATTSLADMGEMRLIATLVFVSLSFAELAWLWRGVQRARPDTGTFTHRTASAPTQDHQSTARLYEERASGATTAQERARHHRATGERHVHPCRHQCARRSQLPSPYDAIRSTAQRPDGCVLAVDMERRSVYLERAHAGRATPRPQRCTHRAPPVAPASGTRLGATRQQRPTAPFKLVSATRRGGSRRRDERRSPANSWRAPTGYPVCRRRTRVRAARVRHVSRVTLSPQHGSGNSSRVHTRVHCFAYWVEVSAEFAMPQRASVKRRFVPAHPPHAMRKVKPREAHL